MKWLFFALVLTHGAIHVMGFAKAFGLAELPQLTQPVSRAMGITWLAASLAMFATGVLYVRESQLWWAIGFAAVVISQLVILSAWSDARFGTVANVLVLMGVFYGFASLGPLSFRAEYRRAVEERIPATISLPVITEADLEPLPESVQRYLRIVGVVGQPRIHHFRAEWRGRIRTTADDPWMEFTAEQYNFPDEPARFFLMDATRSGLPVDVLHVFEGGSATMRVRLLSLFPMVDAGGPEATRAEVVTLLNDLSLLAPGALIDPSIRWEPIDERSVRAEYTVGPNRISAVLLFNQEGELVDFVSEDRLAASSDGSEFTRQGWSTPVGDYRSLGPLRVMSRGEGRWHPPDGEFTYIELELVDLELNGRAP